MIRTLSRSAVVQTIGCRNQRDLLWSLRPIFYSLRLVGIDLDVLQPHSILRRYAFIAGSVLMLIGVTTANVVVDHLKRNVEQPKSTRFWVEQVRKATTTFSNLLLPLILVLVNLYKWKPLWSKAQSIEHFMTIPGTSLWHLRKLAISTTAMVIGFLLLVGFFNLIYVRFSSKWWSALRDIN